MIQRRHPIYLTGSNYEKWDIGPAFDWDRLSQQPLCNPLADNPNDKLVPFSLYANTELANKAGYFPIGANRVFHSGVHLFSESGTQIVRAMAPGYVVAFRFYTQLESKPDISSLGLHHSKTTSFVLLRHEVKLEGETEVRTFYSLYMDLEVNSSVMHNVPWIQKLRRLSQFNANEEIHSQGAA